MTGSSSSHLRRIDALVRAQVVRFRATVSEEKPDSLWNMTLVSHGEVERYLGSAFRPPGESPPELDEAVRAHESPQEPAEGGPADDVPADDVPPDEVPAGAVPDEPAGGALDRMVRRFGLSDLERDVLLVCWLGELDDRYRRLYAYLLDDASRYHPTVDLVLQILRPEILAAGQDVLGARRVFGPGAPLVRWRLVHFELPERSLAYRGVRLDDRVAAHLLGDEGPDARLRPFLVEGPAKGPAPDDNARDEWLGRVAGEACSGERGAVLYLRGRGGSGRQELARRVACEAGLELLTLDAHRAAADPAAWSEHLLLAARELHLRDAAILWWNVDPLRDEPDRSGAWGRFLEALQDALGLVFLAGRQPWEPAARIRGKTAARIDLPVPDLEGRRRLWRRCLTPAEGAAPRVEGAEELCETLAATFQLTGGQIADALAAARAHAGRRDPGGGEIRAGDLYGACRRLTAGELGSIARRVEPPVELGFEQLILPPTQTRQIDELRLRIRYRRRVLFDLGFERRLAIGRGLVALFTGSSGTGKTLAAQLLARDQGVDLFQIDLAAVVSKWVGETEKNLARLFDQAEDSDAVLLFDEADALFGRRGEVSEAQDRWANLETNYLLQRVEAYPGVVILTTNLRQNLDPAFLRRIQTIIDFPRPDAPARRRLWRVMFPEGLERPGDTVLQTLAERFQLTGGEIKNAVLDATFRAVAETGNGGLPAIRERHLLAAVARSLQKEGKLLRRSDFGAEAFEWLEREVL